MTEQAHRRTADEVTIGEVNRNVMALADTLQGFMRDVRRDTLRADVYEAQKAALELRVAQLEADARGAEARADANRRLAVSGLVLPLLVAVLAAVLVAGLPT